MVAACTSGRDGSDQNAKPERELPAGADVVAEAGGIRVLARAGAFDGRKVDATLVDAPVDDLPDGITAVDRAIEVSVAGGLKEPATIEFPVPAAIDGVDTWPVVVWQDGSGGYEWLPTEWSPGEPTARATVEHFSFGFLGSFNIKETAARWAGNVANYFTGRFGVAQPACGDEAAARRGDVRVASDEGDSVKWCFGMVENRRVLRIANNRRSFVEVAFPETWKVTEGGGGGISLDALNRIVSDTAGEWVRPPATEVRLVAGGDTIELEVPSGAAGVAHIEMSVTSFLLSALQLGVEVYGAVASAASKALGTAAGLSWQRILRRLAGFEDIGPIGEAARTCLEAFMTEITDRPLEADLADVVGPLLAFSWRCVPALMEADLVADGVKVFAKAALLVVIGTIVAAVLTAINLVVGGLREIFDELASLSGPDDAFYDIAIGAPVPDTSVLRRPGQPTATSGPAVIVVADTSGSMREDDANGRVKIEEARSAMLNFVQSLEDDTRFGLRTYPASNAGGCDAGRNRVELGRLDKTRAGAVIRTLTPDGDTPTAQALLAAAQDLQAAGTTEGAIVLVSDGEATCGDPCPTASDIQAAGIDVQVHTITLAANPKAQEQLACVSRATGGTAAVAGDTAELTKILDSLSRTRLEIDLDYPSRTTAEVGAGTGVVRIEARVTNGSTLQATNVRARLRFPGGEVAVGAPRRSLGNLEAGDETSAIWQFRPAIALAGRTIAFQVEVTADNLAADVTDTGEIEIVDATGRADAGPILAKAKRIAILGDSFSAGEGAGGYLTGTDTPANACHRSLSTYVAPSFDVPAGQIIACSGAVTAHVTSPNMENGEPAQVVALDRLQRGSGPVDAVVLTIGGNDIGFAPILESCLLSPVPCNERVWTHETERHIAARLAGLPVTLAQTYSAIDAVLNNADARRARGRRAPVIVLAYPRLFPGADRACFALSTFSQPELDLGSELVTDLNGAIEAGVAIARTTYRAHALYVPTTEDAFLPDHTICDAANAYVRSPETVALAPGGPDLAAQLAAGLTPPILDDIAAGGDDVARRVQELFHPNRDGYAAMTRGLVRWSLTDDAAVPAPDPRTDIIQVDVIRDPGRIGEVVVNGSELAPGSTYRIQGGGFAPASAVQVVMESEPRVVATGQAGAQGRVDIAFVVPPSMPTGDHALSILGRDPQGGGRAVSLAVTVTGDRPWLPYLAAAVLAVLMVAGLALLMSGRRLRASPERRTRPSPG